MATPRWYLYSVLVIVSLVKISMMIAREMKSKKWDSEKNFGWYKSNYPQLVGESWIECFNCSAKNVQLCDMGKSTKLIMNSHVCATCGEELYRSVTIR